MRLLAFVGTTEYAPSAPKEYSATTLLLEKSDGGRGSGGAPDLLRVPAPRAGVLGMPGRCSQEKGTAEARSGERKRWWNGEGAGEKGAKEKDAEEDDADDADEDEEVGADDGFGDVRRRWRRRLDGDLRAGAGSGDGEEGVGGLGIAKKLWFVVPWCGEIGRASCRERVSR